MSKPKCKKCNGSGLIAIMRDESCSTQSPYFIRCKCQKKGEKNEHK